MLLQINPLFVAVFGIAAGIAVGYVTRRFIADRRIKSAESKAQNILNEAKSTSQDILLEAKNKALKILDDSKKETKERNAQLIRIEGMLSKKEGELDSKSKILDKEQFQLKTKTDEILKIKTDLEETNQKKLAELQKISGMDKSDAKKILLAEVEREYQNEIYERMKKLDTTQREELDKKAREILTLSVQRYAGSHIADISTTV